MSRRELREAPDVEGLERHSGALLAEDATDETSLTDLLEAALLGRGSSKAVMVELLREFSNTSGLLSSIRKTVEIVSQPRQKDEPEPSLDEEGPRLAPRTLAARLTASDIQAILDEFQAGTTQQALADKYKISKSSVKRLLRTHDVRLRSRRREPT